MMRPVTIAGGGLAGLSLGIALARRGLDVKLHEAGAYPRHRVCGEFLCGVNPKTLERLGAAAPIRSAEKLTSAAWFRRDKKVLTAPLPDHAWGISRHVLDDALRREFQDAGGILYENSRRKADTSEGLVWSAGRIPSPGKWLGLKYHARNLPLEADLEMHLGRGCYLGLSRVENGVVNICGLFRQEKGFSERGSALLRAYLERGRLDALAARLRGAAEVAGSFVGVAGFRLGSQHADPALLTLGDAFGMIPPFTGDGMSMAFESADAAVEPLSRYAQGETSWQETVSSTRARLHRQFSRRLLWAQSLHPFLTSDLGQLLFTSIARIGLLPYGQFFRSVR